MASQSQIWGRLLARSPSSRLKRSREALERALASGKSSQKQWRAYEKSLQSALAVNREALASFVLNFDDRMRAAPESAHQPLVAAVDALTSKRPDDNTDMTRRDIDAAWLLCKRLAGSALEDNVLIPLAHAAAAIAESDLLVGVLLRLRDIDAMERIELTSIIDRFLERGSFDVAGPWREFWKNWPEDTLPLRHPVMDVLERWEPAAEIAEAEQDHVAAVAYWARLSGRKPAERELAAANKTANEELKRSAQGRLGDALLAEGELERACVAFDAADLPKRECDCLLQLGEVGAAIGKYPELDPAWIESILVNLENETRAALDNDDEPHAGLKVALSGLHAATTAFRERESLAGSDRADILRTGALKTVRERMASALEGIEDSIQEISTFMQWSALEEAAGEYRTAGLLAEKAGEHFAAAMLFRRGEAIGEALHSLAQAEPGNVDPRAEAEMQEEGGDYFSAAMLFEELGDIERAIDLLEKAGEPAHAAKLLRMNIGDVRAAFDTRYEGLVIAASQGELVAELLFELVQGAEDNNEKARCWRRIGQLASDSLIPSIWSDRVASALPEIEAGERSRFDKNAAELVNAATAAVMSNYADVVGLDLGTSNSVVAVFNKSRGVPEAAEIGNRRQIPSTFAIDKTGRELVGVPIADLVGLTPRAIIARAKRAMGTATRFRAGGREYRAEEISARIIEHAQRFAVEYLETKIVAEATRLAAKNTLTPVPGEWITEAIAAHPPKVSLQRFVITVPAYFNELQKQATKAAGRLANVEVMRLIHEPTAACLCSRQSAAEDSSILVVDLGAGTFDLSVIERSSNIFDVREIEGDNALGGADVDALLYDHFCAILGKETGVDIAENKLAATRLRQGCEDLKIGLSGQSEFQMTLPYLVADHSAVLKMTRQELERLIEPWLARIEHICRRITLTPSQVIMVGGGALMPAVRDRITQAFGVSATSIDEPLTAVARGAAIQGAILAGIVDDALLIDAVPFSLGIKAKDESGEMRFSSIIDRHMHIPTKSTEVYTTTEDNQEAVRIEVFQGESSDLEDNFRIGEFLLDNLPAQPRGKPQIEVTFDIDADCLLSVTARDKATGHTRGINITDSHLLTPAQMGSLKEHYQNSKTHQKNLQRLTLLVDEVAALIAMIKKVDVSALRNAFSEHIGEFESDQDRFAPSEADKNMLLEIYQAKVELETQAHLVDDRRAPALEALRGWLTDPAEVAPRSPNAEAEVAEAVKLGGPIVRHGQKVATNLTEVAGRYRRFNAVFENLALNTDGDPETLARHFLRLRRYPDALRQFERVPEPLHLNIVELGLELRARARQREDYLALLGAHRDTLNIVQPDFEHLNQTVRALSSSAVLVKVNLGGASVTGSGFAVGPRRIATNRHVIVDESGTTVPLESLRIVTSTGTFGAQALYLPSWPGPSGAPDDVAIIELSSNAEPLTPLRLGFAEVIEVGERIVSLGFPSPDSDSFIENLHCDVGLVNRIRSSEFCSERVLEVSIPLQGGVSGAPILNHSGEVIGQLTFVLERRRSAESNLVSSERAFYAVPVSVLRRLCDEIEN